ncbi:hypothetical protein AA14337_0797 [Acetobacter malorum DSM 14337]|uniref:Transposase n=1 Tax=Acetobacter malorum DSM 14337 TaxID=1307910 RepID=A0ABQ0PPC5_9PROT|nr:hypothetical protein AA14337_0797 [Acetobacter malorum DSM 14337]
MAEGKARVALAVRSDVTLERQVTAEGATWLDRQTIAREPLVNCPGFCGDRTTREVRRIHEQQIEAFST